MNINDDHNTIDVTQLYDEINEAVIDYLSNYYTDFSPDDINGYCMIIVNDNSDCIHIEIRAELDFEEMSDLCFDYLNPVVEQYDNNSYFDMASSGIAEAFIRR